MSYKDRKIELLRELRARIVAGGLEKYSDIGELNRIVAQFVMDQLKERADDIRT